MNNKGFTLIELLAVIVILSMITLVVIGSVSNSLIKREGKECEEQKELAKNAAKIYFSLNRNVSSVTVGELKNDGYFNNNQKIDKLDTSWKIIISDDGYMFENEATLVCIDS